MGQEGHSDNLQRGHGHGTRQVRQTSFGTCKVKLMDIVGIWTLKGRCPGFWTVCQQPGSCCYLLLFPEPTVLVRPNGQPSGLKIKNGREQTLELPSLRLHVAGKKAIP